MKKGDFVLIGLVLVIIIVSIFSTRGTKTQEDIKFPIELTGSVGLNKISYNEYKEMVNNNDNFVVIIERTGCGWCEQYMPIMEEYANEKKISVMYIDTADLSDAEYDELSSTNDYLRKNKWGTPTTLFMQGDRVIDVIGGYTEKTEIDEFFKDRIVMGV